LADIDLDAGRLLTILIELIAEDHGNDSEHANDEIESVAISDGPLAARNPEQREAAPVRNMACIN